MAFIRRTLSPVPRLGALLNREPCQVSSPLSKSSNSQNYPLLSSMGSFDYALYKVQCFILGIISPQSFRPLEKSKLKGQIWRRAFLHFFICFIVGIFIGLTPFVSTNLSIMPFELLQPVVNNQDFFQDVNETSVEVVNIDRDIERLTVNESSTLEHHGISDDDDDVLTNLRGDKLLIIVTPTYTRQRQTYYLTRLANTLKLVPIPCLWIVVEMKSQSVEIAELLRKTGVMYRHLVCRESSTDMKDKRVHLMNVALSHIEKHRMDGIVYFAYDDNVYSVDLFNQMRQIRRFGTWVVAKLGEREVHTPLEGPICNGSHVKGWHMNDMTIGFRRFHAEMSGFAFNSTILWDPKTWNRPTREPIRHLGTIEECFQASTFIKQVVEDESQMECFPSDSNEIMVWHRDEDLYIYPQIQVLEDGLSIIIPLS